MTQYKIEIRGKGSVTFNVNDHYDDDEYSAIANQLIKFYFFVKESYSYFYGEYSLRMMCFMKHQARIEGQYDTFLEMLGGLGCTARIYGTSPEKTFINEWDDACVAELKKNFPPENVFQTDATTFKFNGQEYDVTLADFGNFTLKKYLDTYHPFIDNMLGGTAKFAIITDCSNFYLRYGESSYKTYEDHLGRTFEHSIEGFYRAYAEFWAERYPGWKLIGVEYYRDAGYLLLARTTEEIELKINHNSREAVLADRPLKLFKLTDGVEEKPDVLDLFGGEEKVASEWKELR